MKKLLTFLFSLFIIGSIYAQTCYSPSTKGTTWEITHYNKKGKLQFHFDYEIVDVKTNEGKITYTVAMNGYDKKGKVLNSGTYEQVCDKNGMFYIDMQQTFNSMNSSKKKEENTDVEIQSSMLDYPDIHTAPGTKLKDGELKINAKTEFVTITTGFDVFNRKVEGTEQIETPAGTFNCLKVTSDFQTKLGFIKAKGSGIEWYADGIGMVRSESYNKKGKLVGYSVLTGLNIK